MPTSSTAVPLIHRAKRIARPAKGLAMRALPSLLAREKYRAELDYWRGELHNLDRWFVKGDKDWWGVACPTSENRMDGSDIWSVNAVNTLHAIRPSYLEELRLDADAFAGERILEVGCGPLAPVVQFGDCERHGLDPLIDRYIAAGWPMYAFDVKLVSSGAESMPYPDAWFDSVISVNALDHVDDFPAVAREIQRVLRPGGRLIFEIEEHEPTTTEPLSLNDEDVRAAFSQCDMTIAAKRNAAELHVALTERFGLVTSKFADKHHGEETFTTWHCTRR